MPPENRTTLRQVLPYRIYCMVYCVGDHGARGRQGVTMASKSECYPVRIPQNCKMQFVKLKFNAFLNFD